MMKMNHNPEYYQRIRDRYLDTIKYIRKEQIFLLISFQANFLFFKFINYAFPNAKIIYLKRDPWDNAISLFKANFQESVSYSSSFFGIGNEYAKLRKLMRFWKKMMEGELLLISI